jgi:hypothetical protein
MIILELQQRNAKAKRKMKELFAVFCNFGALPEFKKNLLSIFVKLHQN